MKEQDFVEVIVDGAWFKSFPWSEQLIDPESGPAIGARAIAIHGTLLDLTHPYGVVVETEGTWTRKGNKLGGLEALIPWSRVIGILKIKEEGDQPIKRFGFKHQRKP